ncbi:uncharacterized protein LOC113504606 isoform X1 [Trichoplusia ni]|uniref:Uncharacterized protein LOC113504606 isoform X1 n=2 Tax=Trichoplusia ni TaxID=7111 RepID=A0A7E5WQ68_TRINI|nr:uncharacterized protein LOC113504606 isoform X1 [Trichoplusia ni]
MRCSKFVSVIILVINEASLPDSDKLLTMAVFLRRALLLLMALVLVPEISASNYKEEPEVGLYGEDVPDSYETNERFNRQIHSMINAYRDDMLNERMVIETNSLVDTKYKAWKRNADLINSLLALPKGLNDAGR